MAALRRCRGAVMLLVCWLSACAMAEPVPPAAWHLQQASLQWQLSPGFAPAAPRLDTAMLAQLDALAREPVALPYIWPRRVLPGAADAGLPVRTTWLSFALAPGTDATEGEAGTWLYLPRWQTIGQIAIYGDERLLWHSQADLVWNGFNHPLWIALDDQGRLPLPRVLRLRIDSQVGAGGAVSSLWVGSAAALSGAWRWRHALQVQLPAVVNVALLGMGLFALAVWLRRRRDAAYLLFAVYSALAVLRSLHFYLGDEPLPIPSEWFGWLTVNMVPALLACWVYFVGALLHLPLRRIGPALLALALVGALASLPPLAAMPGMDSLAPLFYLVTLAPGIPVMLFLAWTTWRRGGAEARMVALVSVVEVVLALHDWLMQNHLLGPERFYLGPMLTVVQLLMFNHLIVRRYSGAIDEARQASTQLARQLQAREAELVASDEKLRRMQEHQVLDQERQRLMQDIHDGLGSQLMSALKVAESGQLAPPGTAAVLRECLDDLQLTVDALEPVQPDLLLLLATLRYRLAPRLEGAGLRLRWEVGAVPPLGWLDARSALHVLRIVQEAISNVLQHAGATELWVSTASSGDGVVVQLDNDGQPLADAPRTGTGTGKGLASMQRRAAAIGARLDWRSTGGGARFTLWLPLQPAKQGGAAVPSVAAP